MLALSPSLLKAECSSWNVGGDWFPRGGGNDVAFHLTQKGFTITGLATQGTAQSAKVSGTITGSAFYLDVAAKGLSFRGEIKSDGTIHGNVTDSAKGVTSFWTSSRAMKCADRPASPATPQKPVETSPTSTGAPKINASPNVVTIPDGQSEGTVTLTWDGGPDHPYAEVWMKAGGQDETFVVEQGKGTRSVTVERGKNYLFILSDAGKQLAKVVVISKH